MRYSITLESTTFPSNNDDKAEASIGAKTKMHVCLISLVS
jgi:hypothetical protein